MQHLFSSREWAVLQMICERFACCGMSKPIDGLLSGAARLPRTNSPGCGLKAARQSWASILRVIALVAEQ